MKTSNFLSGWVISIVVVAGCFTGGNTTALADKDCWTRIWNDSDVVGGMYDTKRKAVTDAIAHLKATGEALVAQGGAAAMLGSDLIDVAVKLEFPFNRNPPKVCPTCAPVAHVNANKPPAIIKLPKERLCGPTSTCASTLIHESSHVFTGENFLLISNACLNYEKHCKARRSEPAGRKRTEMDILCALYRIADDLGEAWADIAQLVAIDALGAPEEHYGERYRGLCVCLLRAKNNLDTLCAWIDAYPTEGAPELEGFNIATATAEKATLLDWYNMTKWQKDNNLRVAAGG